MGYPHMFPIGTDIREGIERANRIGQRYAVDRLHVVQPVEAQKADVLSHSSLPHLRVWFPAVIYPIFNIIDALDNIQY